MIALGRIGSTQKGDVGMDGTRIRFGRLCVGFIFVLFFAFAPGSAYAIADRDEALNCASRLVGSMVACESYPQLYSIAPLDENELRLGEALPVYDERVQEGESPLVYLWPILQNNEVVATMLETVDADQASVYRLSSDFVDVVDNVIFSGGTLALGQTAAGGIVAIDNPVITGLSPQVLSAATHQSDSCPIVVEDAIEFGIVASGKDSLTYGGVTMFSADPQLKVATVKQTYDKLCWAACVSSISRSMTGSGKLDFVICDAIYHAYNVYGSLDDIVTGFGLHKYDNSSTYIHAETYGSYLSDAELKRWINNGVPFVAQMGTVFTVNHAVVVAGYAVSSSGAMSIVVMDPWTGSYANYSKNSAGAYMESAGQVWLHGTVVLTEWQKPLGGSGWSWLNYDGTTEKGWFSPDDGATWYWFDANGYMVANNWVKLDGKWYHLGASGAMDTDWYKSSSSGHWYYLGEDGAARTGWQFLNNRWFVFDSDGVMYEGWYQEGSTWYYLRTAPNVPSGGPEGSMLANGTWTINGKAYRFDSSGACLNP